MMELVTVSKKKTKKDGEATELIFVESEESEESKRVIKNIVARVTFLEGLEKEAASFLRDVAEQIEEGKAISKTW